MGSCHEAVSTQDGPVARGFEKNVWEAVGSVVCAVWVMGLCSPVPAAPCCTVTTRGSSRTIEEATRCTGHGKVCGSHVGHITSQALLPDST